MQSTLLQVLVSIQGTIMIPEPWYNEPGYDGIKGTPAGDAKSSEYNDRIKYFTLKHAMIDHLQSPPPGMGELVRRHFALLRGRIMQEVVGWVERAASAEAKQQLVQAVALLGVEFKKLDELANGFDLLGDSAVPRPTDSVPPSLHPPAAPAAEGGNERPLDPDLAAAMAMSLESAAAPAPGSAAESTAGTGSSLAALEEVELERALAMSMQEQ